MKRLEEFRSNYVNYAVEGLRFVEAFTKIGEGHSAIMQASEQQAMIPLSKVTASTTYLQYQRGLGNGGGLILLEVGGAGFFASVKMYSLQDDGLFASFRSEMGKDRGRMLRNKKERKKERRTGEGRDSSCLPSRFRFLVSTFPALNAPRPILLTDPPFFCRQRRQGASYEGK